MMNNTYICNNEEELEYLVIHLINYINMLNNKKRLGTTTLEVQKNTLYLVEKNLNNKDKVWLKINLKSKDDFKKIYDIMREKLDLKIGLHHGYQIYSSFVYNIFINGLSVDLISDNELDKVWLREYYLKDNERKIKKYLK